MPDGVLHLSSLAGSPLLDSAGERLGRVDDLVARLDLADPLPPVIGLRAAIGGRLLFVPANAVARLAPGGAHTSTTKLNLAQFERRPGEILLRSDVLGRSLINVNTAPLDELEIVLSVSETTGQAIIARRSTQKFTGLTDLKSVPGVDASTVDAKARLIFFK